MSGHGGINRIFHCGCCAPPRLIYFRAEGRYRQVPHHEDDDTPAESPVSLAARKAAGLA